MAYSLWALVLWFPSVYTPSAISHTRASRLSACGDFDMGLQRLVGSRYVAQDPPDQLIRRHALGKRLIGEHEPVAKYIGHQIRHVLGQDISATAQECER